MRDFSRGQYIGRKDWDCLGIWREDINTPQCDEWDVDHDSYWQYDFIEGCGDVESTN